MGQVKGSAITARIRYVREHHGEMAWRQLRDGLPEEHKKTLEAGVLPHSWVPFPLFITLVETIDRTFQTGDLSLCREMARYSAEVNLPTLYRLFYKLGSPGFILKRAARLWEVHYDSGHVELEDIPDGARMKIVGFDSPHRAHCVSVLAWAEKSVEMSGGTEIHAVETTCRTRGDELCTMEITWK